MKRYALILALVMALAASFGCAKKTTTEPVYEPTESAELRSAVQTVSDGVIYFAFNRYNLDSQSDAVLSRDAQILKQFPSIHVRIEGNCDDRGTEEYNLALGERRARAVYEYLLALGVPAEQMGTISFGKERPAVLGNYPAAWAANRRDEFAVTVR